MLKKNNLFDKNGNPIQSKIDLIIANNLQNVVYGDMVDELIRLKYPADKVEAIICNHLDNSNNIEHELEYSEFQAYRNRCKRRVKEILFFF